MANPGQISVQGALHALEQGKLAPIIRGAMFAVLIIALTLLYLFVQFRGFATPTAMDQAQIARNLADGKGFTTSYIRPLALWQLQSANKEVNPDRLPDFYQSPLGPFVNSFALRIIKSSWNIGPADLVYAGDRMIAGVSILFFLLAVGVWYFVGSRLFDSKLALIACAIMLLTDILWQFSLSGLPQMLMLLLFGGATWCTVFALQNRDRLGVMLGALFGAGLLFGLMILAHGLAVWIFAGWLVFALLAFPPRGLAALAALAAAVIIVAPWLIRNQTVCGSAFGLAIYAPIAVGTPEEGYLRSIDAAPAVSGSGIFAKLRSGVSKQGEELFSFFGMNIVAGAFFLSLLHRFRVAETAALRWGILLMWVLSVIGMGFYGLEGRVSSNQLHVLFIPIFVLYGMAFLLVLWSRTDFGYALLRIAFITLMALLAAVPMLATLFGGRAVPVQWPPYVPPVIATMGGWFDEKDVIASDMPWAVAWYAQRKSLLLPESVRAFNDINDYRRLGGPVTGLYLTPITGNARLFSEIYKGPYREWALLITRPPKVEGFALPYFTLLPIEGECILFSDRDRWTKRN